MPAALDEAVRDPRDVAAHLAYAKILRGLRDPHGELIELHHALAGDPPPSRKKQLEKQLAAWMARHAPPRAGCDLTWQLGFVRACTARPEVQPAQLAKVLAAPALRLLDRLVIDAASLDGCIAEAPLQIRELCVRGETIDGPALAALLHDAVLPELRELTITAGAVTGTIAIRLPRLGALELRVERAEDGVRFACDAPRLQALTVVTPKLAAETRDAILHRVWPLTRLGLFAREPVVRVDELVASRVFADLVAVGLHELAPDPRLGSRALLQPAGEREHDQDQNDDAGR